MAADPNGGQTKASPTAGETEPEQANMVVLKLGDTLSFLALSAEAKAGATASGYGGDSTGARPWWGGLLMGAYIAYQAPDFFQGKTVLELGCGAAPLPTMAAGNKGAKTALATDGCPAAVRAAAAVFARNSPSLPLSCMTDRQAWEEPPKTGSAKSWDVVMFADVIYSEDGAQLLARTIEQHLAPGGTVLGAVGLLRFGSSDIFGHMQKLGFTCTELPIPEEVLERAVEAAVALAGANITDLGASQKPGAMRERCRLVKWQKLEKKDKAKVRDDAEDLERQAKEYLQAKEAAITFAAGWEPTE